MCGDIYFYTYFILITTFINNYFIPIIIFTQTTPLIIIIIFLFIKKTCQNRMVVILSINTVTGKLESKMISFTPRNYSIFIMALSLTKHSKT